MLIVRRPSQGQPNRTTNRKDSKTMTTPTFLRAFAHMLPDLIAQDREAGEAVYHALDLTATATNDADLRSQLEFARTFCKVTSAAGEQMKRTALNFHAIAIANPQLAIAFAATTARAANHSGIARTTW